MPEHSFKNDPQYEQIYTNERGAPMGRPGNGLGDVWGATGDPEAAFVARRSRLSNAAGTDEQDNSDMDWPKQGVPEILLAMASLTERQRFVIECRYGLRPGMDGERLSLREVASLMGVSFQTVDEQERAALAVLRRTLT